MKYYKRDYKIGLQFRKKPKRFIVLKVQELMDFNFEIEKLLEKLCFKSDINPKIINNDM